MTFNPDIHRRRSIRLKAHDYSSAGAYYVTVCAQNRECVFGNIMDMEMKLNDAGRMVQGVWNELSGHYPGVKTDSFVIMPNHIHGIIVLTSTTVGAGPRACPNHGTQNGQPRKVAPTISLPDVMYGFKSMTTTHYRYGVAKHGWPPFHQRLWQRNYYERVIRDDAEIHRVREYITGNPARWFEDEENPDFGD
jgi:REP element-mobilizing transposase RayT